MKWYVNHNDKKKKKKKKKKKTNKQKKKKKKKFWQNALTWRAHTMHGNIMYAYRETWTIMQSHMRRMVLGPTSFSAVSTSQNGGKLVVIMFFLVVGGKLRHVFLLSSAALFTIWLVGLISAWTVTSEQSPGTKYIVKSFKLRVHYQRLCFRWHWFVCLSAC